MKKVIISEAKQKRLDRYALYKKEFDRLVNNGGDKTAILKDMALRLKVSTATLYKAIKK